MSEPTRRPWQSRARRDSAFLQAVSSLSFDSVIVLDGGGRIRYRSPSTEQLLGYEDDDVLGHHFLDFAHAYDHARLQRVFRHVVRVPGGSRNVEVRIRASDGSWVWAQARMTNLLEDPAVRGVVVNTVLIDDRKALEIRHAAAKLDPHFLYNVLHSIAGMVREGRSADAVEALARVRGLTEGTLTGAEDQVVPLWEEWRWVDDYAALEQLRFGAELTVRLLPLPAALEEFPVPCRLVQPLVENAVKHGLRSRPGGGLLQVSAEAGAGEVRIRVLEEGAPTDTHGAPPGFRLGLRTLRQRLSLHFGEAADLRLDVQRERSDALLILPSGELVQPLARHA